MCTDIYGPTNGNDFEANGHNYIVSFIDAFTRMVVLKTTRKITSERVTELFDKFWVSKFRQPAKLLSDQGRQYLGNELRNYCSANKIKQAFTTAYNPRANGIAKDLNNDWQFAKCF